MAPECSCEARSPYSTLERSVEDHPQYRSSHQGVQTPLGAHYKNDLLQGCFFPNVITIIDFNATTSSNTTTTSNNTHPLLSPIFEGALRPSALWIFNVHHLDRFLHVKVFEIFGVQVGSDVLADLLLELFPLLVEFRSSSVPKLFR